jgi:hypothetical protein
MSASLPVATRSLRCRNLRNGAISGSMPPTWIQRWTLRLGGNEPELRQSRSHPRQRSRRLQSLRHKSRNRRGRERAAGMENGAEGIHTFILFWSIYLPRLTPKGASYKVAWLDGRHCPRAGGQRPNRYSSWAPIRAPILAASRWLILGFIPVA